MSLENFEEFGKIVKDIFEEKALDYQNQFTAHLGDEIAKRTPIDTGLAKGNWHADFSSSVASQTDRDTTRTGLRARRKIYKAINTGKFENGRTVYLKNGVNSKDNPKSDESNGYIIKLDNGYSRQAPNGMVDISLSHDQRISRKALKAVRVNK